MIANIHLVPTHTASPAALLRRLLLRMPRGAALGHRQEGVGIIAGDFNMVDPEEGRLDACSISVLYDHCPLAAAMSQELTHWAEVVAPGYSRRQTRAGLLDTVSWIGRVFTNCSTADMRSCRAHASYANNVCSPTMTSDHAPLCFRALVLRTRARRVVPQWVCRHPEFAARLNRSGVAVDWSAFAPVEELEAWKLLMHRTAPEFLARSPEVDGPEDAVRRRAQFLGEARRTHIRCDWEGLRRLREALRADADLFFAPDIQAHAQIDDQWYAAAMQAAIWEGAMLALKETPEDEANAERGRALRAQVERQMREWSPARRRLVVQTIIDGDGTTLLSTADELQRLETHWGRVFGAEWHPEDAAARRLLAHGHVLSRPEADAPQVCTIDEFATTVRKVRDSSPGPDRLPYSAWGATVGGIARIYRVLIALTLGAHPLAWLNAALVNCIPKGVSAGEAYAATESEYRPLTLADIVQNLVAKAVDGVLAGVASTTVHAVQTRCGGGGALHAGERSSH